MPPYVKLGISEGAREYTRDGGLAMRCCYLLTKSVRIVASQDIQSYKLRMDASGVDFLAGPPTRLNKEKRD